jgi:hypothetical protein
VLEFVALMEGNRADLRGAALKLAAICKTPLAPPEALKALRARENAARGGRHPKPVAEPEPALSEASMASDEPVNAPLPFALKLDPAHSYLAERGLGPELVELFGLGFCSRGNMAGRICIPIHNEQSELVAYAGRWPDDDVPDWQERYKLPMKFQKSRVLFNLH